jgi:hypothetical protein
VRSSEHQIRLSKWVIAKFVLPLELVLAVRAYAPWRDPSGLPGCRSGRDLRATERVGPLGKTKKLGETKKATDTVAFPQAALARLCR